MPTTATDPASIIAQRTLDALRAAVGDELPANFDPLLTPAKNPEHGDFQSNGVMPLAKRLGKNPRELADEVIAQLAVDDIAEPPTVAGPGFINFRLKASALADALAAMDSEGLAFPPLERTETVVVDLCGVNLAKQMHVGHIRATVIGDSLARMWARLGHTVIRQNHFGDWGLPIAMVTQAVMRKSAIGELDLKTITLADLEAEYRAAQHNCSYGRPQMAAIEKFGLGPKAHAEWEDDAHRAEENLASAKQTLVALQSGDPAVVAVWERISEVTLEACFANCARLQATVTPEATAGESTYRDELAPIVADLESRGIATTNRGALVVMLDDMGIKEPCLIRKGDGGFLYATTDIAAIKRRVQDLGADRVIYAVDSRQSLHFKQVFAASHKAGYTTRDGAQSQLIHAAFGTILGEDGTPFKTRSGDTVKLADLLEEAVSRAADAIAEKNPNLSPADRALVAEQVGIGALKYADLSSDRIKDYVFSFDRMLAFEGNTGPYLQYAHVRVRSILRKAQDELGVTPDQSTPLAVNEPMERALALELLKYPSVVAAAADNCEPHRLCGYLYDLASAFSRFFEQCPVLKAEDDRTRDARLRMAAIAGKVLADGLSLLGIAAPERM